MEKTTEKIRVILMAVSEKTEFELDLTPEEFEGLRKIIAASMASTTEPTQPYVYARHMDGSFVRVEDL